MDIEKVNEVSDVREEMTIFEERVATPKRVKMENETQKKERNTLGKVVSGCVITEMSVAEKIKEHVANKKKPVGKNQNL